MTSIAFLLLFLNVLALIPIEISKSNREARERAFQVSRAAALVALVSLAVFTFKGSTQWWYPFPALVACITVVATGMSRLSNTTRRTYSSMMVLSALSYSSVFLPAGWPLVLPLIGSCTVAWREVRARSLKTARVFALYMGVSCLLALVGSASPKLLVLVVLALGLREACFPFHSWLPSFVEAAPMGIVVTFITPQIGVFLHLKTVSGQLPTSLHFEVAALGVITALAGALLASVQTNLKRVVAYLFISQSGLVAFGLENSHQLGRAGALACWLVMGLGMAGLSMSVEALAARRADQLELDRPGRDFESTPALATTFLLSGLAMVGLPGTLGFVSEDLLIQGSVGEFPALGYALIVVTAINAVTILRCLLSIFSGPKCEHAEDLVSREKRAVELILGSLFLLGMFPGIVAGWFGG